MARLRMYETGGHPNAVEVSPDGAYVDVAVFPAAVGTTPTRGWDFGVDPFSRSSSGAFIWPRHQDRRR